MRDESNGEMSVGCVPASRTEPSQIRAGRPLIPLNEHGLVNESGVIHTRYHVPIELVNEDRAERLFAMRGANSLDLNETMSESFGICAEI